MSTFDKNLKRLRNNRNLKQEDLARRMHVSRQTVSGWETGRRQPDLDTLKQLAEVLDADIHELIFGNKPGDYPRFQKRYVLRVAVSGGILAALLLFRLLLWPYLKAVSHRYHWGLLLTICISFLPQAGAFAFGSLIPALIQLSMPLPMKKQKAGWWRIVGILTALPTILFWLNIPPWRKWIVYPVGHGFLSYFFPFISGICIAAGTAHETAY